MCYNAATALWPTQDEFFFRDRLFQPQRQVGGTCVSTALAILTGQTPEQIREGGINTQNPVSWSQALMPHGMKLAYCPVDVRRLGFYMKELIAYDDLFLLCYYSLFSEQEQILNDPDENGWIMGSHVVILHKDKIIDSATGLVSDALSHECSKAHTKRLFRVVPVDHERGL